MEVQQSSMKARSCVTSSRVTSKDLIVSDIQSMNCKCAIDTNYSILVGVLHLLGDIPLSSERTRVTIEIRKKW